MIISVYSDRNNVGTSIIAFITSAFYYIYKGNSVALLNPSESNTLESYTIRNPYKNFNLKSIENIPTGNVVDCGNSVADGLEIYTQWVGECTLTENLIAKFSQYDMVIVDGYYENADLHIQVFDDNVFHQNVREGSLPIINKALTTRGLTNINGFQYALNNNIKLLSNEGKLYDLFLNRKERAIIDYMDIFVEIERRLNNFERKKIV